MTYIQLGGDAMESLLLLFSFIWLGYAGYNLFVARSQWKKFKKLLVLLISVLAIMIILSPLFRALLVTFFSITIKVVLITVLIALGVKIYEDPQAVVCYYKAKKWIEGNRDENYGKKDDLYDAEIRIADHTREELESLCKEKGIEFKGRAARRMMIEALTDKEREAANEALDQTDLETEEKEN